MSKFENVETTKVWWYSAFTKTGAYSLANIMKNKFGCKILSEPRENKDTMWEFSFTNPFMRNDHASAKNSKK